MDYLRGLFGAGKADAAKVWQEFVESGGNEDGKRIKIVKNADKDFKLEYVTQQHFRRPSRESAALGREIANVVSHQKLETLSLTPLKTQIHAIDSFIANHSVDSESTGELLETKAKFVAKKEELESQEPPSPKTPPSSEGGISSESDET